MRSFLVLLIFLLASLYVKASIPPGSRLCLLFNNNDSVDVISGAKPRFVSSFFVEDRFGNEKSALYFQGNEDSYLTLGPNNLLHTDSGSVSLWFNMHGVMGTGYGVESNPIFSTRSHAEDDCNDAIYLGVDMNTRKLNGSTLNSEMEAVSIYSKKGIRMNSWHHAVITYNHEFLRLYFDGVLQYQSARGFNTRFLPGDSIMIGIRTGSINQRYFLGCVDDIIVYHRVLNDGEVEALFEAPDPNVHRIFIRWTLLAILIVAAIWIIIWLIRRRISLILQEEKAKALLRNRWLEQENKVLSAQMNPHFVFNSLNSIQQLIISNENEKAQHYLSKFSKLIRKILETNTRECISLKEEVEIIQKYLQIESLRFNNVFSYSIGWDPQIEPETVFIPHFTIQPIIENAIWHGLLPKEGPKHLSIHFSLGVQGSVVCTVDDNGVGRKAAALSIKRTKKSLAINFIKQRLKLFSMLNSGNFYIEIHDKEQDGISTGTQVCICLPQIKNLQHETSDHH